MARIRSIHPGLLTDEAWMTLTVEAPLACALYIGLLTEADDHGIFEWKPLTIKARILPAPSVDIAPLLEELVRHRFITAFEAGGKRYGAIRNFTKYQRPKKPNYVHPTGPDNEAVSPTSSEPLPNSSSTSGEKSPQREDVGGRKKEEDSEPIGSGADGAAEGVADASAAERPVIVDLKAELFGAGLAWLADRTKRKPAALRSMVGRWISQHGEAPVLHAFMAAQGARWGPAFEPVAYIEAVLAKPPEPNGRPAASASGIMGLYVEEENARRAGNDQGRSALRAVPLLPGPKPH